MGKESENIDIVIMLSTYNGEKYLDKQLESIVAQNFEGKVLLFVRDDGSTDKTKQIIESWKEKIAISVIDDGVNLGAAKSFWKLFQQAPKAKYYAFVDQDDIWDKNKLSVAVQALEGSKEKTVWFSNCRLINSVDQVIDESMNKETPILTLPSQLVCGIAQGCAMVFNYELLDYCRTKEIKCVPMHDTVILSYALAAGNVIYEETPCFSYRVHENNVVAKEGKSCLGKLQSTYKLWFAKKSIHSISELAGQIFEDNQAVLSTEVKEYLEQLSSCRKSIIKRFKVIFNPLTEARNKRGLRSFKIRSLLGII